MAATSLTTRNHAQAVATKSKAFTNEKVLEILEITGSLGAEIDNLKADKPTQTSATLPTLGWKNDSGIADYPYKYDLADSNVDDTLIPYVVVTPASQAAAIACGLCSTAETVDGAIRFYAKLEPSTAISIIYWLEMQKTVSDNSEENGGE